MADNFDFEQWLSDSSNAMDEMLQAYDQQGILLDEQKKSIMNIKDELIHQIQRWNLQHLRAQVGWPLPQPLDVLQPLCERVALLLLKQLEQYSVFLLQLHDDDQITKAIKNLYDETQKIFAVFIKRCLVIEKHPERILIKDSKQIKVSVRLLLGKELFCSAPTDVACSLHLENEVSSFYEDGNPMSRNVNNCNDNIIYNMPFKESEGVYRASYDKLTIPKKLKNTESNSSSPQGRKNKVLVADQKSCFLFKTELTFKNGQNYTLEAISVPFVVLSHSRYEKEKAEALVFWDNAFADKDRKPFENPNAVPVDDFLAALNYRWTAWSTKSKQSIGRSLTENQLEHLKSKLRVFPEFRQNPNQVTKAMFNQLFIYQNADGESSFTFSQWFFEILTFVHDFLKEDWQKGCIEGFIARNDARLYLQDKPVGTFLLRFSDTSLPSGLGGISVTYKKNQSECTSTPPWTKADLEQRALSYRLIVEEPQCRVLSHPSNPSFLPKEAVFTVEERRMHPGYPKTKTVESNDTFHFCSPFQSASVDSPDSGVCMLSRSSSLMDLMTIDDSIIPTRENELLFSSQPSSPFLRDPLLSQVNTQRFMNSSTSNQEEESDLIDFFRDDICMSF